MTRINRIIAGAITLLSLQVSLAQDIKMNVDSKSRAKIQPTMYGVFFEDINFAADGGIYAEMVKNRSFEFPEPKMGWQEPNSDKHSLNEKSGIAKIMRYSDEGGNHDFARISINDAGGYVLINEGFRGMGVKKDAEYRLSFQAAKPSGDVSEVIFELVTENGTSLGKSSVSLTTTDWSTYETKLISSDTEERAKLKITFSGTGEVDLDMVSLFPEDTWKGRENGMRKDIVQLLADLEPGFLRFPGGCIAEGRTLAKRYQWKKTVGPVEEREVLVNRWNTEFMHKYTPDYYQSFGLGYFEYFQLAEDLGAEPLPILSVGIACQYNTGEMVPLEDLDPYVQDALDLIEFANGSTESKWGKIRAEMGHPEPFNLKYIGIGNEQWGPEYIERYEVFHKAIREQYPEMNIVSGSGPSPDGDFFEYGWKELTRLKTDLIDEHYYRSPEWFRTNAKRYDDYDREGPKVFAGEYAAHPKGVEDGPLENNWEAALSEAAFMTGLERNADVVYMTSYAPLMAHIDAWQWAPDMIWFNNLESYGTANYQVQKLFSNNAGTDLISIKSEGKALTGQNNIYASAVKDSKSGELIMKIVNTSREVRSVQINFSETITGEASITTLKSADLLDVNSFEDPENIAPESEQLKTKKNSLEIEIAGNSMNVIKIKSAK